MTAVVRLHMSSASISDQAVLNIGTSDAVRRDLRRFHRYADPLQACEERARRSRTP
jgi:hypothetical protein